MKKNIKSSKVKSDNSSEIGEVITAEEDKLLKCLGEFVCKVSFCMSCIDIKIKKSFG